MSPFVPGLHWVQGIAPHRVALMPRPRGGEWLADEVAAWRAAGIASVVSLLEPSEVRELELSTERGLCGDMGLTFRSLPIPDRGTPASARELSALVDDLYEELQQGKAIAIHCRAGIGRTGLMAGCLLHKLGVPFQDVFHLLSRSRGVSVPDTEAQVEWVRRFAGA